MSRQARNFSLKEKAQILLDVGGIAGQTVDRRQHHAPLAGFGAFEAEPEDTLQVLTVCVSTRPANGGLLPLDETVHRNSACGCIVALLCFIQQVQLDLASEFCMQRTDPSRGS